MSSSQDFSDRRSPGNKALEKSNFAQTCNRLSQYLKRKGSLRDLGLEIAKGKSETPHPTTTTRNMFPNMEKPSEIPTQLELMDLFPQYAGIGCPSDIELEATDKVLTSSELATVETEPKNAQMTIFYGGKVLVLDDFPADKVGELMQLAIRENAAEKTTASDSVASGINYTQERFQLQPQAIRSDIPIAGRASLHRFFNKRKDRVAAIAPYQVQGGPSTSSSKNKQSLDLNL